jgi:hypothetical protein
VEAMLNKSSTHPSVTQSNQDNQDYSEYAASLLEIWTKNGAFERNTPIPRIEDVINRRKTQITSIPRDQKSLIDTAGQIFSMRGDFREALLAFAESNNNLVEKEMSYVDEQIHHVCSSIVHQPKRGNKSLFFREITHMKKLVQIGIQIYRNTTFDNGNIVDDKFEWCVVGKDLQEVFRFLPKVRQSNGTLSSPTRGSSHSRWYPLEGTRSILRRIALEFRMLQLYVSSSNTPIKSRQMYEEIDNVPRMLSGVLDLDIRVDYKTLELLREKSGVDLINHTKEFMSNRGNPYREANGVYIYNKNGTSSLALNEIFKIAQVPNIYPHHISLDASLSNKIEFQSHIKAMNEDINCSVALMSINKHSLFWIRNNKRWYLCDPWKKRFFPGPRHEQFCRDIFDEIIGIEDPKFLQPPKPNWTFLSRNYEEQKSSEGSCSVASLSRVLQTSVSLQLMDNEPSFDELSKMLIIPIENWSAMLALSLVRLGMFQVFKQKKNKI